MKPLDPKLLLIFEGEQREHVQRMRALLDALGEAAPGTENPALEETFRRAHTLKGAARAVGLESIELLAHRLETLFARVRAGSLGLDPPVVAAIHRVLDAAEDVLAGVLEGRGEADVSEAVRQIGTALGMEDGAARPAPPKHEAVVLPVPPEPPARTVRVAKGNIDDLVRSSAQLLAATAAQSRAAGQIEDLERGLREAQRAWLGRRRQAARCLRSLDGDAEFAPLFEYLQTVGGELRALEGRARAVAAEQRSGAWTLRRLGAQVHHEACRVRMTPAREVFDGFRRMVRDLARVEGKEVEFRAEGLDVEADRLVLERLRDPVMHLLRNAVTHGVETPSGRAAAGKPSAGSVVLSLEVSGDRLAVTVRDDGRGFDIRRVAEAAVRAGLITQAEADAGTPRELARLVLQPGLSTAQGVTMLAGRGMGMSVVQEEAARLHGEVTLAAGAGPGASIVLTVPLSISTHHVLLVSSGGRVFALPSRAVERLCRLAPHQIETVEGIATIRVGARTAPLARLADLLELPEGKPARDPAGDAPLLVAVLGDAGARLGLSVDAFLEHCETMVKELGLPPGCAGLSNGGVALEDGTVAVVLSPAALLERFRRSGGRSARKAPGRDAAAKSSRDILVVDDSITTRSLEKSILEAHGYQVRLAVDGLDALGQLRAQPAGLVIADVSMPRMDGFQLLEHIKADRDLAHIPVIIVTSLERPEDQNRGLSLGANAYIVKRKFDQRELLETVRQLL